MKSKNSHTYHARLTMIHGLKVLIALACGRTVFFDMSASAIFILDSKGKVLIYRNYRDDIDMSVIEKFLSIVIEKEDEGQISPVIHYEGASFIYVKYNYLYLVALTKRNANAAVVFAFLYRLINVSLVIICTSLV